MRITRLFSLVRYASFLLKMKLQAADELSLVLELSQKVLVSLLVQRLALDFVQQTLRLYNANRHLESLRGCDYAFGHDGWRELGIQNSWVAPTHVVHFWESAFRDLMRSVHKPIVLEDSTRHLCEFVGVDHMFISHMLVLLRSLLEPFVTA